MRFVKSVAILILLGTAKVHLPAYAAPVNDSLSFISTTFLTPSYHHGFIIPHHRSMRYYLREPVSGFEVYASRFYTGLQPNRPIEFGLGYYHSSLGNDAVYGHTNGVSILIAAEYLRNISPLSIRQSFSCGLGYNTRHFDINKNPDNRIIGSPLNVFLIYSLNLNAPLGKDLILSVGPSLAHMSNGNMKHPNFGINVLTTQFALSYKIHNPGGSTQMKEIVPDQYMKNRFSLVAAAGSRQISRMIPENFLVASFVGDYSRRFTLNQSLGAGFDLIYDPVVGKGINVTDPDTEDFIPWHIGLHLTVERIFNRLSFVVQPGYRVITLSEQDRYNFYRVGIRYRLNKNIIASIAIKAYRFKADFIDIGIGYSFEK